MVIDSIHGSNAPSDVYPPPVVIQGETYNFYNATTLEEHIDARAVEDIHRRVDALSNAGGINLLVYIVKCDKRPDKTMDNFLRLRLCDSKVPIVIVVTGFQDTETQATIDAWWEENKQSFTQPGISFDGYACVRSNSDGSNVHLFEELAEMVKQLVFRHRLSNGWKKVRDSYAQYFMGQNSLKIFDLATSPLAEKTPSR